MNKKILKAIQLPRTDKKLVKLLTITAFILYRLRKYILSLDKLVTTLE